MTFMTCIWQSTTALRGYTKVDVGYWISDKNLFRYPIQCRTLHSSVRNRTFRYQAQSDIAVITDIGLSAHLWTGCTHCQEESKLQKVYCHKMSIVTKCLLSQNVYCHKMSIVTKCLMSHNVYCHKMYNVTHVSNMENYKPPHRCIDSTFFRCQVFAKNLLLFAFCWLIVSPRQNILLAP